MWGPRKSEINLYLMFNSGKQRCAVRSAAAEGWQNDANMQSSCPICPNGLQQKNNITTLLPVLVDLLDPLPPQVQRRGSNLLKLVIIDVYTAIR